MKIGAILLILISTVTLGARAPRTNIDFEFSAKDLVKKYDYGYQVTFENNHAQVKLWKGTPENFISKTLKKSEYRYFVRDWNERMLKSKIAEYKLPEKTSPKIPVHIKIKEGKKEVKIMFDRTLPPQNYVETRMLSWLQYLETKVL